MEPSRRKFLHVAAGGAVISAVSRIARAQTYPTRPVRIIVGFAAGGAFDIAARLIAQSLSDRLGQQFVVENRPGAASNTATEYVVHAMPDGHTLLLGGAVNAVNASLYEKLNFDFIRDIAPVGGVIRFPNIMEVNSSFPVETVPQFIAYAKARPGRLNMASGGNGTTQHLAGELFKSMAGVDMQHVPYRGAALALTDLLGGQVQVMFDAIPSSIEHIRAGKLRALAVTTASRSAALPDVPAMDEFIPTYEASGWAGLCAPKATPTGVINRLNKEINASLADERLRARFADLGGTPLAGTPAEFGKLIADETDKWAKVIKAAGIKAG